MSFPHIDVFCNALPEKAKHPFSGYSHKLLSFDQTIVRKAELPNKEHDTGSTRYHCGNRN